MHARAVPCVSSILALALRGLLKQGARIAATGVLLIQCLLGKRVLILLPVVGLGPRVPAISNRMRTHRVAVAPVLLRLPD
jgi:hypothetical protein